jgi:hypothetical protein
LKIIKGTVLCSTATHGLSIEKSNIPFHQMIAGPMFLGMKMEE